MFKFSSWIGGAAVIFSTLFVITLVVDGASLAHVHAGLRRPLVRPVLEPNHRVTGLHLIFSELPDVLLALAGPVTVGAAVAWLCLRLKNHKESRFVGPSRLLVLRSFPMLL